jgi:hypothetical protein
VTYQKPQCNCPDAASKKDRNIASPFVSEQFNKNWTTNDKGNPFGGIRNSGGYCIHEIAVIQYRKEVAQAFPNGIPYQPPINSDYKATQTKTTIGTNRQTIYGDKFL